LHVLVPVDFSKPSEKTLEYLKSLSFIRKITLLNVIGGSGTDQDQSYRGQDAERQLMGIKAGVASQGIRVAQLSDLGIRSKKSAAWLMNRTCPWS
jgi:dihydrodipicolinate reductase